MSTIATSHETHTDIAVKAADAHIICRISLTYDEVDPLIVSATLLAPSGASVSERTMLRSDLRAALLVPVGQRNFLVGPAVEPELVRLIFVEHAASVGVLIPRNLIEKFLDASDALVPADDSAEAQALTEEYAAFIDDGRVGARKEPKCT